MICTPDILLHEAEGNMVTVIDFKSITIEPDALMNRIKEVPSHYVRQLYYDYQILQRSLFKQMEGADPYNYTFYLVFVPFWNGKMHLNGGILADITELVLSMKFPTLLSWMNTSGPFERWFCDRFCVYRTSCEIRKAYTKQNEIKCASPFAGSGHSNPYFHHKMVENNITLKFHSRAKYDAFLKSSYMKPKELGFQWNTTTFTWDAPYSKEIEDWIIKIELA